MPTFRSPTDDSTPKLSVWQAQEILLADIPILPSESVGLVDAHGRVLRENVFAAANVPSYDNTAMDGYAVVAQDTEGANELQPVSLRVIGDIPAGTIPLLTVERGTAARIMTGAPMPVGADAVAQVEITDAGTETVCIRRPVARGTHIRAAGEDLRGGDVALRSGIRIGAGELAILATVGRSVVSVSRRPRVAILATGNEVVEPGHEPAHGRIINSNSIMLAALIADAGGIADLRGIVPDRRESTVSAIESALDCDFVVTTGGVSAGAFDFVKEALDVLGAETRFWRVAMKPGKPVLFAALREKRVFGLPGNPASAFVGFALFAGPALRKAAGQTSNVLPPLVAATSETTMQVKGDRPSYLRMRVASRDGSLVARPTGGQGSHMTTSLVEANGLAVFEHGRSVSAGDELSILLLATPFNS